MTEKFPATAKEYNDQYQMMNKFPVEMMENYPMNVNAKMNQMRNSRYGSSTGVGTIVPPSDLMKISDPNMKMAMSVQRGKRQDAVVNSGKLSDVRSVDMFVPNQSQPSDLLNSNGTDGLTISTEVPNNMFN